MSAIAVLSDIHGNYAALEAVVADLKTRGIAQVVNLGDSLSGPLLPLDTARFLLAEGWPTLAGNHERQILELQAGTGGASDQFAASQLTAREFQWLRSLKPALRLNDQVFLCHGTPSSDCTYLLETVETHRVRAASASEIQGRLDGEESAVIACGHTHVPRVVRMDTGQLILNPGSVGLPAYADDYPVRHCIETGSTHASYGVLEHDGEAWRAMVVSLPYDNQSMAKLARSRGRVDWEVALLTGYMPK